MDISIRIEKEGNIDHVHYVGPINEEAETFLQPLIPQLAKKCVFHFKDVEYVNSCGVRSWINFIRLAGVDRDIKFKECNPEVVMQMNMIPNFKGQAEVESVYGYYVCEDCDTRTEKLFVKGENLPETEDFEFEDVMCPNCSSEMELEELEEEFFAFCFLEK